MRLAADGKQAGAAVELMVVQTRSGRARLDGFHRWGHWCGHRRPPHPFTAESRASSARKRCLQWIDLDGELQVGAAFGMATFLHA